MASGLVRLWFALGDSWHGHSAETMWALPIEDNVVRLDNSPFFANGVSYLDEVRTTIGKDGELIFVDVVRKGGHSTYRILIEPDVSEAEVNRLLGELNKLGCTYEGMNLKLKLYSIDVPPETDLQDVLAILRTGEQSRVWEFEDANIEHGS